MTDEFLQLDIELLICRYGRQRVLGSLAELEQCSISELKERLEKIRRNRQRKKSTKKKSLIERLETEFAKEPDRISALRPYAAAYENGIFLPTLKTVQRFLESRGISKPGLKSRKVAESAVLEALSTMEPEELSDVRRSFTTEGQSDFSLLSEAILSRGKRH